MTTNQKRGLFITIEGIEGAGKSTMMAVIKTYLEQHHIAYQLTREPGGTHLAEQIRKVVLDKQDEFLTPQAELLLMFAARSQNITHLIKPALSKGTWVISDRFTDASYAYQGSGRGLPTEWVQSLEQWVQDDLRPDQVILLDVPAPLGQERAFAKGQPDRIESEKIPFFEKVRQGYLARAANDPKRYCVIDASQPLDDVRSKIIKEFDQLLEVHHD